MSAPKAMPNDNFPLNSQTTPQPAEPPAQPSTGMHFRNSKAVELARQHVMAAEDQPVVEPTAAQQLPSPDAPPVSPAASQQVFSLRALKNPDLSSPPPADPGVAAPPAPPKPVPAPVAAPVTPPPPTAPPGPQSPQPTVAAPQQQSIQTPPPAPSSAEPVAPAVPQPAPQPAPAAPAPAAPPMPQATNPLATPQPAPKPDVPVPAPKPEKPAVDVSSIVKRHQSVSPLATQAAAEHAKAAAVPEAKPKLSKRPKKSLVHRLKPIVTAVLVFLFVMALFKAPVYYYQLKFAFNKKPATQQEPATVQASATPMLYIPKINVKTPIVFESSIEEAKVQTALESGVVHYGNTANPGEVGNDVIFGHSSNDWDKPGNYKFIFVLLEKLQVGDTFSIDYQGKRYDYEIYNRQIINATDVGVVAPTSTPVTTLITCWPTGTSAKRLIVQGKQTSPAPAAAGTAPSSSSTNNIGNSLPGVDSPASAGGKLKSFWQSVRDAVKGTPVEVKPPSSSGN